MHTGLDVERNYPVMVFISVDPQVPRPIDGQCLIVDVIGVSYGEETVGFFVNYGSRRTALLAEEDALHLLASGGNEANAVIKSGGVLELDRNRNVHVGSVRPLNDCGSVTISADFHRVIPLSEN